MVIYVLDQNFNKILLMENYISLIWVERLSSPGDFDLLTLINYDTYNYLKRDNYLMTEDSDRIMIIETRNVIYDPVNGNRLKITGRSYESVLERRIVTEKAANINTSDLISFSGNSEQLYANIIQTNCLDRGAIPNLSIKTTGLSKQVEYQTDEVLTVSDLFAEIGEQYGIGYKITLNENNKQLEFRSFVGDDHTVDQTTNKPLVFSSDYDNLMNLSYIESNAEERNVAMVIGDPIHYSQVYPAGTGWSPSNGTYTYFWEGKEHTYEMYSYDFNGIVWVDKNGNSWINESEYNQAYNGLKRKEIIIDARDSIKVEDYDTKEESTILIKVTENVTPDFQGSVSYHISVYNKYVAALKEFGIEELQAKEYDVETFEAEGSIDNLVQWQFNRDYFLGDIVNLIDDYGLTMECMINEVISSYDESGIVVTPNFTSLGFETA